MRNNTPDKTFQENNNNDIISVCLCAAVSLVILVSAVLPDSKIVRLKLEAIEVGAFLIFFLWAAASAFAGRFNFKKNPLNFAVAGYACVFGLFYFFAPDKNIAQQEFRRVLLCAGLFLPIANGLGGLSYVKRIIFVWCAAGMLASFYGIMQAYGGVSLKVFFTFWYAGCAAYLLYTQGFKINPRFYIVAGLSVVLHLISGYLNISKIEVPYMDRPMSTFGNPIFFAAYLVLIAPVVMSYAAATKNKSAKFMAVCAFLAISLSIFLSKTRAAWIAFAVSSAVWLILQDFKNGWRFVKYAYSKKTEALTALALLAGINIALLLYSPSYKKAVSGGINYLSEIAHRQQAHALIWRDTLKMWLDKPVTGVGLGSFHINFPGYASAELKSIWPQGKFIVNDAHNEYIQILAETGIVGFSIFAGLIYLFFRLIVKIWRAGDIEVRGYLAGYCAGSCALLIMNIFSVDMRFVVSSAYLFIIFGLTSALKNSAAARAARIDNFTRVILLVLLASAGVFVFKNLIRPYAAYRQLKQEKDFFDEKILEPLKTIDELNKMRDKYPNEPKVYERLGWVYAKEKKWDMAISNYTKAGELNPKLSGAFNNLGNIYFQLNNKDKAIEYYKKAVSIDPKLIDARINMGIAYYYKGMLKESAQAIKGVLELDPDNPKAISMLKRMTE